MDIWQLPIIDPPVPWILYGLSLSLLLVLLVRRWRPRPLVWALGGAALGILIAVGAFVFSNVTVAFGDALPLWVLLWAGAGLGAAGFALGGLVGARVWRRVVSILAVPVFLAASGIGINAGYGLDPTLGDLFGISARPAVDLPTAAPTSAGAPDAPLYETWKPPADMPAAGTQGSQVIPATVSGFDARPAGIYLPPAAQVDDAPALPLVIMMMGFPGNPDPSAIGSVLDGFAAKNNGLAPIVVVADQIGGSGNDPACADSEHFGNARTYVLTDVVSWAKKNLNIIEDPAYWTIAGYSNGGGCAITYGATHPELWKNILDVSGEEFPGSEHVDDVVANIYGGDQAAFEAAKPLSILQAAAPGTYKGMTAVFTAGADDAEYTANAAKVAAVAKQVGMSVTTYEVPGAGHTGPALPGGLEAGFQVLYPVLGLSAR
jgi:enterochelin esterase-like enzyme